MAGTPIARNRQYDSAADPCCRNSIRAFVARSGTGIMKSNRDNGRIAARMTRAPYQSTNKPNHVLTTASADNSRRVNGPIHWRLLMNSTTMPPNTIELPIRGEAFENLKMLSLRTKIRNALIGGISGMYEYSE